jgi:hypothetical protein
MALALLTGSAAASGGMRWPFTFQDPVGDANGGPDIVSVVEGADKATATIGLRLHITGITESAGLNVFFNTDRDRTTGDGGYDAELWASDTQWDFAKWDVAAGGWQWGGRGTQTASKEGDDFEFTLPLADLGGVPWIPYLVETYTTQTSDTGSTYPLADRYPDNGAQNFDFNAVVTPPPPVIRAVLRRPWHPQAGKPFLVEYRILDRETYEPRTDGTVSVAMSIGGRTIHVARTVANGDVTARGTLPPGARGKLLAVTVTYAAAGQTTQRHDGYRVR